jgi:sirohydrochlorin ferrochelatase
MCGTRSPSPKAPATDGRREALLIAAHGDCGGARDNHLANAIAARMRRSGQFADVGVGYMRGTPNLAEAAAGLAGDRVRICPLFTSDGYYVRQAIPARLGITDSGGDAVGRRYAIMSPTGLSARLPQIVSANALAAARDAGIVPGDARLLVVAHGSSKDAASRHATEALAAAIRGGNGCAAVDTAYLEEPPLLADQLARLPGPLVVAGFFIGEGMHGAEDMRLAVAQAGRDDICLAPPLSRSRQLIEAICADIAVTPHLWPQT